MLQSVTIVNVIFRILLHSTESQAGADLAIAMIFIENKLINNLRTYRFNLLRLYGDYLSELNRNKKRKFNNIEKFLFYSASYFISNTVEFCNAS